VGLDHTTTVGRRGTGKSALFYRLGKFWTADDKLILLKLAPEEIDILGLRPYVDPLGARFNLIRAYYRLAWRYALSMEIATHIFQGYTYANLPHSSPLIETLRAWKTSGNTASDRLRFRLKTIPRSTENLDGQIADLATTLELADLEVALKHALADAQQPFFILIDDLDEGYEPDQVGIGLVCGIIHAAIDVQARFPNIKTLVFLRDNIFRAVARLDPDYSRTIEGRVLRLPSGRRQERSSTSPDRAAIAAKGTFWSQWRRQARALSSNYSVSLVRFGPPPAEGRDTDAVSGRDGLRSTRQVPWRLGMRQRRGRPVRIDPRAVQELRRERCVSLDR
jgi:hypothetical protein